MPGSSSNYTSGQRTVKVPLIIVALACLVGLWIGYFTLLSPWSIPHEVSGGVYVASVIRMYFAGILREAAPGAQIALLAIHLVLLWVYWKLVEAGCEVAGERADGAVWAFNAEDCILFMLSSLALFFVLIISGTIVVSTGPYADTTGRGTLFGIPGLGYFLALPAGLLYIISYILWLPLFVWGLICTSPAWIAGIIAYSTQTPVTAVAERSAARERPDRLIARELAAVLRAQELDDDRAARLFNELSPLQQWVWRAQYAKRTQEAARVRKVVAAQTGAIREEDGLARDTFELERARRAKYDG